MSRPALRIPDPPPPDRRLELAMDGAMSVAEAVVFLGVGMTEVYAMIGRGELPSIKLGRRRLIPKRALVEVLAANMTGTDREDRI